MMHEFLLAFLVLFFAIISLVLYLQKRSIEKRIERSARVLSGKTIEKLAPLTKEFKYDAHDARWLGEPIDFIIFDGYSQKEPKQIVFLEVKSKNSKLSNLQEKIKKIVESGKIKFEELRIK